MARRALLPLAALLLLRAAPGAAQRAGAALSPDSATVGQVVQAAVAVDLPAGWTLALPDSLALGGDLENAGPRALEVDSLPGGGRRVTARYPLIGWRPGEHALPALEVVLIGPEDARRERRTVALPALHVVSVLPVDTAGLEPRPPKDVLGPTRSVWTWLLAALLLAAAVALALWLARRRRPAPLGVEEPRVSARQRAIEELERVRTAGLLERGELKAFYGGVTGALRGFVEALDAGWGTDLTTRELRARLNGELPPPLGAELVALLEEADQVKFAGRAAAAEAARAEWERARSWVEAVPEPGAPEPADTGEGEAAAGQGNGPAQPREHPIREPSEHASAEPHEPPTADPHARFRPPAGGDR